ncbi:hypothetical protein BG004_007414 [Podila humilis]|nr:hypothetical protein BG004_007414 [Podila humilis]
MESTIRHSTVSETTSRMFLIFILEPVVILRHRRQEMGLRHQYTQKGSYDTNWGPGSGAGSAHSQGLDAPSMPFNPMHQQQTVSDSVWSKQGGKKLFNYLPMGAPSNYHPHQPSFNPNLPLQAIPVSGYSTQGIAMGVSGTGTSGQYDVDRRPPKSAELFDPDGPQQHTGSLGPQYSNNRHQSFSDNFDGSASDRQLQGFNGSSQPQAQFSRHSSNQSQQSHHSYQHHQQQQPSGHSSQLGFSSVSMTRSYSSSSSGTGNTSSPAPQASKKNSSLLYDYSTPTPSYEASVKCTPEAEKPSPLSHILEIYDFNASDNIYDDLVLPAGSKLRRTKASSKDGVNAVPTAGQSLVVFKTAALATEAMAAFQEGRESWMGSDSKLTFDDHDDKEGKDGVSSLKDTDSNMGSSCTRIQLRFNIRVWTPVLVNSLIPVGSGAALASMAPSPSSATASTHPSSLTSGDMDTSAEDTGAGISDPEKEA